MTEETKTYVYICHGRRAGSYGYFRGVMADRIYSADKWGVSWNDFKVGIRLRDGDFIMVPLTNLREATSLEMVIEERYGAF